MKTKHKELFLFTLLFIFFLDSSLFSQHIFRDFQNGKSKEFEFKNIRPEYNLFGQFLYDIEPDASSPLRKTIDGIQLVKGFKDFTYDRSTGLIAGLISADSNFDVSHGRYIYELFNLVIYNDQGLIFKSDHPVVSKLGMDIIFDHNSQILILGKSPGTQNSVLQKFDKSGFKIWEVDLPNLGLPNPILGVNFNSEYFVIYRNDQKHVKVSLYNDSGKLIENVAFKGDDFTKIYPLEKDKYIVRKANQLILYSGNIILEKDFESDIIALNFPSKESIIVLCQTGDLMELKISDGKFYQISKEQILGFPEVKKKQPFINFSRR